MVTTKQGTEGRASVKVTEKSFRQAYRQLLTDIFDAAWDPDICNYGTVNELAAAAGLNWVTVSRLWDHCCRAKTGTQEPRLSTVFKLAKAVGMDLTLAREALNGAGE